MGYEIAAGIGVARADKTRDAIVMVGDGSYLMMHTEMVSAVAEGIKFIIVLIQNHGYASIGHLSEDVGSQRYGTLYRFQDKSGNNFEKGEILPIDLATNAESLGMNVIRVEPTTNAIADLSKAVTAAKAFNGPTLIHINSNPLIYAPDGEGWWDVPVAAVSTLESTQKARADYEQALKKQKPLLGRGAVERNN
jgi:3D-(3,5/4)-trihydroxycyclohexane-1,2-dione acylhydrolase (decyclizing)